MEKFLIATGKTIDLAIQAALDQLSMDRDSVSVEVLENAKSGFLGIGAQPAKVKVSYEVPDEEPKPALSIASRSKPRKEFAPAAQSANAPRVIAPAAPRQEQPRVIAPAAPQQQPRPERKPRRAMWIEALRFFTCATYPNVERRCASRQHAKLVQHTKRAGPCASRRVPDTT